MVLAMSSLLGFMTGVFFSVLVFAFDKGLVRVLENQVVVDKSLLSAYSSLLKKEKDRSRYDSSIDV